MFSFGSFAHSGRTDGNGGHRDNQNKSGLGSYHYHHGNGPHLHPNGVCPYSFEVPSDNTPTESNNNNSTSSSTTIIKTSKSSSSEISVSIVNFDVKINGIIIDNEHNKYPLIIYKDITYFPMTFSGSRFMGLETYWNDNTGLKVISTGTTGAYNPYDNNIHNDFTQKYSAKIPSFSITVNEKKIDNLSESYPVLSFRDVTYFPLTWNYVINEFKWNYSWSKNEGLIIGSNPKFLE
jgi:hypothetical protein